MRLRCSTLALIFLLTPLCVFAQAPARMGILVQEMGRAQSQAIKGLTDELARLGYVARKNLHLETRDVKGNRSALQPAAGELVKREVALIFTTGTSATRAAAAATQDIPVVFVHPGDPLAAGVVKQANTWPANLTGVAAYARDTTETRLEYLKAILPDLRKIVVLFDGNSSAARENFNEAERAAKKLGIAITPLTVKSSDELRSTINGLRREAGTAIFQISDELIESEAQFLFEKARARKIPTMFNEESWAINGALAAYGPNYLEMGRKAAGLVVKIIKGERANVLPIERANQFDLTLNYRTSRFIDVGFSAELLKKANKVIR